ncbi:T9SS type A sorting domain-containing protein, partial [Candidatus Fermentibacteria bacterium]|nr:T9SS type A sorting domain-containing protein [Candidatus Fermentibacteria bacterium]
REGSTGHSLLYLEYVEMKNTRHHPAPRSVPPVRLSLIITSLLLLAVAVAPSAAATYTVIITGDSGAGSLRQAITDANGSAGADTIVFNIPTSDAGYVAGPPDYWSITILSTLPTITQAVVIDGYSQPGAQRNTVPTPGMSDAVLKTEIRGDSTPSGSDILRVSATGCRITGLVLNRARANCLYMSGDGTGGHTVDGNYIGTDITGTVRQGSTGGYGIQILGAANNTIGGSDPGARNLISGAQSVYWGVVVVGYFANNNVIIGNYIGTDVSGTYAIPNAGGGVVLAASNNFCGMPGAGNLISGNAGYGVRIADNHPCTVQANLIGTDVTGTVALGNGSTGIYLDRVNDDPNNNTIGGLNPGEGNVIAYNTGGGVDIETGTGNRILSNSIHSNGGLGIDLGSNGVTANDDGDPDTGANGLQNYPVLTSVVTNGTDLTVAGSLNSTASTTFTLQFFANTAADPTGYGEGQTLVGPQSVVTDAAGNASFQFTFFGAMVPVGDLIAATATSSSNNTSEFSLAVGVVVPVELTSFAAMCENGAVRLTWGTASEDENLGFHVYRAEGDASVYARLTEALISGAGTTLSPQSYSFVDEAVEPGMTYWYRVADVDMGGVETSHGPVSVVVLPTALSLARGFPNPFSDETTFRLRMPAAGEVDLAIYDLAGQKIRQLLEGGVDAGLHLITWDGKSDEGTPVGPGTYLCRAQAGSMGVTRQVVVLN